MKREWLVLLSCAALGACTTYKLYTETDSSQAEGVLQLSYEYRKFESPKVDERQGLDLARQRCTDWGFGETLRRGEERKCLDGTPENCSKWRVTRQYQCLARGAK